MSGQKPETHYGEFLFVLIILAVSISVGVFIWYLYDHSVKVDEVEKQKIQHYNCEQTGQEVEILFAAGSDIEHIAAQQYKDLGCNQKLFGADYPNHDQEDAYFLTVDCTTLNNYIKNKDYDYENAIPDYKVKCLGASK